ncbi:hypothetical protein GW750_01045 [bacterium]|nr:hypothetical protein [bacterium]
MTYDELVDRLKDCAVLSYEQSFRTARDLTHLEKAKDVIQDICNNTK